MSCSSIGGGTVFLEPPGRQQKSRRLYLHGKSLYLANANALPPWQQVYKTHHEQKLLPKAILQLADAKAKAQRAKLAAPFFSVLALA